jgi:hypothetical protein
MNLRDVQERVLEILAIADVTETALHVDHGAAVDPASVPRLLGMIVARARQLAQDLEDDPPAKGGAQP